MRILVTGATGFVGPHLVRALKLRNHHVFGTAGPRAALNGADLCPCDIRDASQVLSVIRELRPQAIYHLAALSSVACSLHNPRAFMETNFGGTLNLLEALRQAGPSTRLLVVGSAHCYGTVKRSLMPITEEHPLAPENPYAASKAAADLLALQYFTAFGIPVIRVRTFNHTGPGQTAEFVCSDFARQVASIDSGQAPPVLKVGNLKSRRDFSDVRDVANAYVLLMEKGKPGEVYNVCSGSTISLGEIVQRLASYCSHPVRVTVEQRRLRPGEALVMCGSNRKLRRTTGWKPAYKFTTTLQDVFAYWRESLKAASLQL